MRNASLRGPLLLVALLGVYAPPLWAADSEPQASPKYPPATVEMTLNRVSERVYYVQGAAGVATDNQGFISNAGFVVTDVGVVVFDALGTPALAQLLLEKIRAVSALPIVKVVVSHYHADHIYGLQVFKGLGAEIYAPAGAEVYLASAAAGERLEERRFSLEPWVNDDTRLIVPDHILVGENTFRLGGVEFTIDVVGAAHSNGDLTLLVEPDRVLFSGDIIFEGRLAFLGDANTKHWRETLERMETSHLTALIPGHGPAAREPTQAIAQTRRYLAFLHESMAAAVDELAPFDEAYRRTDWSEFAHLPAFAQANRRNAYQVYLALEAEAVSGR